MHAFATLQPPSYSRRLREQRCEISREVRGPHRASCLGFQPASTFLFPSAKCIRRGQTARSPRSSKQFCCSACGSEKRSTMPNVAVVGDGLVPKRETGVADFVSRNPDCQGHDVVVAILDTGVDPGAPGLRRMPDGSAKVIDCIDCTGGGDVEMFDAEVLSNGKALRGLSGRELILSDDMISANKSGSYRVGLKAAYALLPRPLVQRLKRERRVRFDEENRTAINKVRRRLEELRRNVDSAAAGDKPEAKLALEECEAQEEMLSHAASRFADPGPLYDCVTFFDGVRHRAVVDVTESGDLSSCALLEDYRLECRYATLYDLCNFTVNIWDEGRTLSICVDSGSHGTHVAGMVSAYYPEASHMNGTAPFSRIVSLKIGDTRLDAMETHAGLNRAMAYLLGHSKKPGEEKTAVDDGIVIDLVNMSFGEPTKNPDHGRFVALASKLVRERNVVFFCSAGNNGPALSSVGAPGGTSDSLIGVGAYVTPRMLTEAYAVLQADVEQSLLDAESGMATSSGTGISSAPPNPCPTSFVSSTVSGDTVELPSKPNAVAGMPYTWTSRGPSADGSLGVSICAPGAAIAAIPQWNLSRKRLMNGTSMASPAACGTCAVLVSYLKKRGVPYTSDRIRSAIENSARPLGIDQLLGSSGRGRSRGGRIDIGLEESSLDDSQKYSEDLVFAGGFGSIDVGLACSTLERLADVSREIHAQACSAGNGDASVSEVVAAQESCIDVVRPPLEWRYKFSVETSAPQAARKSVGSFRGGGILGGTRGIYLRGMAESSCVQRMMINVTAVREDEELLARNKAALAAMETTILLEASEPWVTTPASIILFGSGRDFPVVVDPTGLEVGKVHFCEINGYVNGPGNFKYRVFRVPVTVIAPEAPQPGLATVSRVQNVRMSPGAVLRRFYDPPSCCSYGILRVTAASCGSPKDSSTARVAGIRPRGEVEDMSDLTSAMSAELVEPTTPNLSRSIGNPDTLDPAGAVRAKNGSEAKDSARGRVVGAPAADSRFLDIHIVQVAPRQSTGHTEFRRTLSLIPGATKEILFPLIGGVTAEIAVGHRWSSMGDSYIQSMDVIFCGLSPQPSALHMPVGAGCFPRLDISNRLPFCAGQSYAADGSARCNPHAISAFFPKANLHSVWRPVGPFYAHIRPLSNVRDMLPESKQVSELVLEYEFVVSEKSSAVRVTFPGLNGHVYESAIEGGPYVTIHDANRKLWMCSDIYPGQISLEKGTYFARASIRHERVPFLEKLRGLPAVVVYKLASSISLDVFDTSQGACLDGETDSRMKSQRGKDWRGLLEPGEVVSIYFSSPKKSSLPPWSKAGDSLVGKFSVDDPLFSSAGDPSRESIPEYEISMPLPVVATSGEKSIEARISQRKAAMGHGRKPGAGAEDGKSDRELVPSNSEEYQYGVSESDDAAWMEKAMRDLRVKAMASQLKGDKLKDFDRMAASSSQSLGHDLEFLVLKLQRADAALLENLENGAAVGRNGEEARLAVIAAADEVLAELDPVQIAAHFGLQHVGSTDDSDAKKEFQMKRASLVAALFRKARAMFSVSEDDRESTGMPESHNAREGVYKELERWQKMDGKASLVPDENCRLGASESPAAITVESLVLFAVRRHFLAQRFGLALRVLHSHLSSPLVSRPVDRELVEIRAALVEKLAWDHLASYARSTTVLNYPRGLEPL